MTLAKIVSGGQTGADRAALDWAIAIGISHGGWCPKGRLAEDGPIPERYALAETPTSDYLQRNEWNVRDSDGTVIFSVAPVLKGGSKRTAQFAKQLGKPLLHVVAGDEWAADSLGRFVLAHSIRVLNVAGPRASNEPAIAGLVHRVLDGAFRVRPGWLGGPGEG